MRTHDALALLAAAALASAALADAPSDGGSAADGGTPPPPMARLTLRATLAKNDHQLLFSLNSVERSILNLVGSRKVLDLPQGTYFLKTFGNRHGGHNVATWLTLEGDRELQLDYPMLRLAGTVTGAQPGGVVRVESDLEYQCTIGMGWCSPVLRFREEVPLRDGGFEIFVPEAGEYRVLAWVPDAGVARAAVKVPGEHVQLALAPGNPEEPAAPWVQHVIRGTVRAERSGEAALEVCGVVGNLQRCAHVVDGGFTMPVELPDLRYSLRVSSRSEGAHWYSEPLKARAGDDVALVAKKWVPRKVRVTDPEGKPVPGLSPAPKGPTQVTFDWPRREDVSAPGFVVAQVETTTVGPSLTLQRLPLRGAVYDATGQPAVGAAVALVCASAVDDHPVKWARYLSDTGPSPTWTYWPGGVQCVREVASVDAAGRFEFPRILQPFSSLEVRWGSRLERFEYSYGQPLELVLP